MIDETLHSNDVKTRRLTVAFFDSNEPISRNYGDVWVHDFYSSIFFYSQSINLKKLNTWAKQNQNKSSNVKRIDRLWLSSFSYCFLWCWKYCDFYGVIIEHIHLLTFGPLQTRDSSETAISFLSKTFRYTTTSWARTIFSRLTRCSRIPRINYSITTIDILWWWFRNMIFLSSK